jgi:hypothetical protein
MNRMIAFCGLVCTECEGYLATQANDEEWKERLAARGREEYGDSSMTAASVTCDGCLTTGLRLCGFCSTCEIRACGTTRGVQNCACCPDYESCTKIAAFIQMVPAVRHTLEAIRANLS